MGKTVARSVARPAAQPQPLGPPLRVAPRSCPHRLTPALSLVATTSRSPQAARVLIGVVIGDLELVPIPHPHRLPHAGHVRTRSLTTGRVSPPFRPNIKIVHPIVVENDVLEIVQAISVRRLRAQLRGARPGDGLRRCTPYGTRAIPVR